MCLHLRRRSRRYEGSSSMSWARAVDWRFRCRLRRARCSMIESCRAEILQPRVSRLEGDAESELGAMSNGIHDQAAVVVIHPQGAVSGFAENIGRELAPDGGFGLPG